MSAPSSQPENIDYARTANVARLHAAAAREASEPVSEGTPVSLWAVAAVAVVGICAGVFLNGALTPGESKPPLGISGTGGPSEEELRLPENWKLAGKQHYSQCAACHGANGEGLAGQFPPLKGSEFVTNGEKRLVAVLLHGVAGPLKVKGASYNNVMPKLGGAASMTDKQLAQLLSYIRNEWGNSASILYEDQIQALKKEIGDRSAPYNEEELLAIPIDANAPPSTKGPKPAAAAAEAAPAPAAK